MDEKLSNEVQIRMDLTSQDFPSLWIELENNTGVNTVCGGFYREWAPSGIKTAISQITLLNVLTRPTSLTNYLKT